MKILITGGNGTLGKELIKIIDKEKYTVISPNSKQVDITDFVALREYFRVNKPKLVIHCAAVTDVKKTESNPMAALNVNIIGTCNVVACCEEQNIKLIHISTDHVFDGQKGNYSTDEAINPITNYAKSKGAAELAARMYKNSLVIRTSFFGYTFPYEKAFDDQWSSKDYIDIIAPKVLEAALSDTTGIVHCASERRTIFEIAKERKKDVQSCSRKEINIPILFDTSLK